MIIKVDNKKMLYSVAGIVLFITIWGGFTIKQVAGITILIAIFTGFLGFVMYIIHKCKVLENLKKQNRQEKIIMLAISFFVIVFMYSWVGRDQYIYYWDYGTYWEKILRITNNIIINPLETLKWIFGSVNSEEYNNLQAAFIAFPFILIGKSFLSFTLVVTTFYLIPTFLVATAIVDRILSKANINISFYKIYFLVCLFANAYRAIGYGYGDVSAVLMMMLSILLLLSMDYNQVDTEKCVLLSITVLMPVLLRRYFGYWCVAFVIGLIPYLFVSCSISDKKKKFNLILKKLFIIGGLEVIILIVLFLGFVKMNILNNYGISYAAYNTKEWLLKIKEFSTGMSLFVCITTIVGISIFLINKKNSKKEIIFILTNCVLSVFLYLCNQQMALQHYYVGSLQVAILFCVAVIYLYFALNKNKVFSTVLVCLYIMNFLYGFSLIPSNVIGEKFFMYQYISKVRSDIDEIREINRVIRDGNDKYLILSSSLILNDDIINRVAFPYEIDRSPNLKHTSHVDLVNGFPEDLFTIDKVIVGDPIQYHLEPEGQQAVGILAEEILDSNSVIGDNFKYIEEYSLDNGVTAKVYEKEKEFTNEDIDYLIDRFNESYADYPELFENRMKKYKK